MKQKYLIILLLLFSIHLSHAHDSNVAAVSIYLDKNTNEWKLTTSLSTYGLFRGLEKEYGKENVDFDDQEDFNKKLDTYIQKSFFLSINMHNTVKLDEFNPVIADHQSNIYYILKEVPAIPRYWDLSFNICKENGAQINIIKITFLDNSRSFHLKKEQNFQTNFITTKKSINEIH